MEDTFYPFHSLEELQQSLGAINKTYERFAEFLWTHRRVRNSRLLARANVKAMGLGDGNEACALDIITHFKKAAAASPPVLNAEQLGQFKVRLQLEEEERWRAVEQEKEDRWRAEEQERQLADVALREQVELEMTSTAGADSVDQGSATTTTRPQGSSPSTSNGGAQSTSNGGVPGPSESRAECSRSHDGWLAAWPGWLFSFLGGSSRRTTAEEREDTEEREEGEEGEAREDTEEREEREERATVQSKEQDPHSAVAAEENHRLMPGQDPHSALAEQDRLISGGDTTGDRNPLSAGGLVHRATKTEARDASTSPSRMAPSL